MDEHTISLLEFDRLLDLLAKRALSEPGASQCRALRPDLNPDQARRSWKLIDEARGVMDVDGAPPLDGFPETAPVLQRVAVDGLVLKARELLLIGQAIRSSRLVKSFLRAHCDRAPLLFEISGRLPVWSDLEQTLDRSIGLDGEILDSASPELARLRRDISGLRGHIHTRLSDIMRTREAQVALQDDIITRRAGRYVIPLKSSSRRDVPGLIHDVSSSGATAFVEPLEVVEDNNRLSLLKGHERREVERILRRLSMMVLEAAADIAPAADLLAEIDRIFAMAAFSRQQRALAPILDERGGVDIRQARHPLLLARLAEAGQRTVPVDIRLTREERLLVVSGINAGGKTVALKTLGLLMLMAQAGFHLPMAEGGRIPFFDRILAVIGDEQNLQSDLSTFSGHVRRLSWVMDRATERSLILLDELGTGTDPAEGAALALAILENLKDRGAWVMTATHYQVLKAWAHLTPGVGNAAVKTDPDGRPVFGLEFGSPGFSAGLAMARELGLDPEVVARAEDYLEEGQKKTLALMARLEEERAALAQSRIEAETLNEEMAAAMAQIAVADRKRAHAHETELNALRVRVEEAISRAETEFREIKVQARENESSRGRAIQQLHGMTHRMRASVREPRRRPAPLQNPKVGDRVMVRSLGKEGRVSACDTLRGRVEVEVSGLKVHTELRDLARPGTPPTEQRPEEKLWLTSFSSTPRELNLLGLTVDEALPMVDKSLDQAQLNGGREFAIIHGIGTGRLREAVRGFLSQDGRVKTFHPAARQTGGEGVTVVELND